MRTILFCLTAALMGATLPAAADTLELGNCKFDTVRVETYEQWDPLCVVAKSVQNISGCAGATLTCTAQCKVKVQGARGGFHCLSAKSHSGEMLVSRAGEIVVASYVLGLRPGNFDNYCECWYDSMHEALGH